MKIILLLLLLPIGGSLAQNVTLISAGSSWKYRDNGSNQGTAWRATSFNDSSWPSGNAELGYGDGGEATVVSYGPYSYYKYITTYFRKSFSVTNPALYSSLTINLLRDDGAVVYVNGTEVARSNMPATTITYTTKASASISGTGETTYYPFIVPASVLIAGTNVIAVEIHQYNRSNTDISFNLSLVAASAVTCAIPASLNSSSIGTTTATISWGNVAGATGYRLNYRVSGTSTWTSLNTTSTSLSLTGLTPNTSYEFSVQAICGSVTGSFSPNSTFTTLPIATCGVPGSLSSSSISASDATINWSAVTGATSYNIRYRPTGSSTWITVSSTTTSKIISGLNSGTQYEYSIQAVCNSIPGAFSSSATFTTTYSGTDSLITTFDSWKYLDNGTNQGSAWITTAFNDALWLTGNAELGYGDGDEATLLSYGTNASVKYVTTYFRKTINVANPAIYAGLALSVIRDDGIVVYLNGNEVYRNNMPAGVISYNTYATAAIGGADEYTWLTTPINPSLLTAGTNVIAVEIHQQTPTSSDISFSARLVASGTAPLPSITRGAYIQKVNTNSATIRWRTNTPSNSKVDYGTTASLGNSVSDANLTTEHAVTITGLNAGTKYYYSIGTTTAALQAGPANNFYTAPETGSLTPVRIWVTGDFGNGSAQQAAVRNSFATYTGTTPVNLWLWLGDNAYATGTDAEYQSYVFNVYPEQLKSIPLYPAPGNHDYANTGYQNSTSLGTNFPYFSNFSVPQVGEAGGIPSHTPKYYSFNYGNIHFISLDSYGSYNNAGSAMYNWLNNDLAANTQRWTVVYFHHPPYSLGTHNSDTETELINMRTNIVPLLENYHVDLVLSGHSHVNERSYMIKGHFGSSSSFTSGMKISSATNNFTKTTPFDGTVYAVCGTSGQNPGTVQAGYPMPCMYFNNNSNNCSLVMDISGDNLVCRYLASTGAILDQFSITKTGARLMAENKTEPIKVNSHVEDQTLVINYYLEKESTVEVSLITPSGQLLMTPALSAQILAAGFHRDHVEVSGLAKGVYILKVRVNNEYFHSKIILY